MNYIIIGASQGIGFQVAKKLISNHNLILCSRNSSYLKKKVKGENIHHLKFDALKQKDHNKLYNFAKKKFKVFNGIIFCNGGLGSPENIYQYNIENWKKIFDLNFTSNLSIISKIFPLIKLNNFSKIIFFSGGGAFNTYPKFSAYSVSKTALVRYSENLAEETKKNKIVVNCIAPGFINTNFHKKNYKILSKLNDDYKKKLIINKNKKPNFKNVVGLIDYILSTKSLAISGKIISANFDPWRKKNFLKYLIKQKNSLTLRRQNLK